MPLCIRFIDTDKCIIQFSTLVRVTEAIATQICGDLKKLDLDMKSRSGVYGASNMSSDRSGVQAHMIESPLAIYTHCSGHCLNLVISHSSNLPVIRNVLDKMKATCLYFLNSPKRNGLLSEILSKSIAEASKRKPLIDLCKTCWAERHSAYQYFYECYVFIIKSLSMG